VTAPPCDRPVTYPGDIKTLIKILKRKKRPDTENANFAISQITEKKSTPFTKDDYSHVEESNEERRNYYYYYHHHHYYCYYYYYYYYYY